MEPIDHIIEYWMDRSYHAPTMQEQLDALKAIRLIAPWHDNDNNDDNE